MASAVPNVCAPRTLQEWRSHPNKPRSLWQPLEPFLLSQGYTLWRGDASGIVYPPTNTPRTADGFAYTTTYTKPTDVGLFGMGNSPHCPARTKDNRDVLIRIMSIGEDRGEGHRRALSRLATGHNALRGDNHVVPMLGEIVRDDMTFAIFPLLYEGFDHPWYYQFSEVLNAVDQVLEGINFCHERLVAHLDLDRDNILTNCVAGPCQARGQREGEVSAFRSLFPVRYYINDFEFAVTFDADSEPSSRVVSGLPITGIRTGQYGRDPAPEMLSSSPYCPFRADIWQLGTMFMSCFDQLGNFSEPLIALFKAMRAEDPSVRPSAASALERVRQISRELPYHTLSSAVPKKPVSPPPSP